MLQFGDGNNQTGKLLQCGTHDTALVTPFLVKLALARTHAGVHVSPSSPCLLHYAVLIPPEHKRPQL